MFPSLATMILAKNLYKKKRNNIVKKTEINTKYFSIYQIYKLLLVLPLEVL